jgi:hypothetical protein
LVLNQAPGKTGKSPVFPLNSRKLFQKLKFWNSLDGILLNHEKGLDKCFKKVNSLQEEVSVNKKNMLMAFLALFSLIHIYGINVELFQKLKFWNSLFL